MSDIPSRSPARLRKKIAQSLDIEDPFSFKPISQKNTPTLDPSYRTPMTDYAISSTSSSGENYTASSPDMYSSKMDSFLSSPMLDTLSDSGSGKYSSDSEESIFSGHGKLADDFDLDSVDLNDIKIYQIDDVVEIIDVHVGIASITQNPYQTTSNRVSYVEV